MRGSVLALIVALTLLCAPSVHAAVTPVDGHWQANADVGPWAQVVYFSTEGGGHRLTSTNGLVGSPIDSCSWSGRWSDPATVPVAAGVADTGWHGAAPVDPTQVRVHVEFVSPTAARVRFTISCTRAGSGPATRQFFFDATTDTPAPRTPRTCRSARMHGGELRLGGGLGARTNVRPFRRGAAFAVKRSELSCRALGAVMGVLLPARDELGALAGAGYRVTRYARVRVRGRRAYRVSARRGRRRIGYARFGALRVDHRVYRAGQHVDVRGATTTEQCTAGYDLSVPGLAAPVGLTAAHCNLAQGAPVFRGFDGTDPTRPPQLGITLAPPGQRPAGLDATVFSIFSRWGATQEIERGRFPPLFVHGTVPTDEQTRGSVVCFAGRSSGADQCGRIIRCPTVTRFFFRGVKCADVQSRQGDSGGPVYLEPGEGLSTFAVGIVTGIVPRGFRLRQRLVYTPIEPILATLNATLPPR